MPPHVARRELVLVVASFAALTAVFLYPLTLHPASLGRVDNGDGQFAIWNVAWVARALILNPLGVLDANIFHPHRWTLAYSEMNLGAGILAIPVYWLTGNAYAAHNSVLLLSFVLSGTAMYALARYLVGDWRAAFVAGICFAFGPHLFAHLPHIQLLMTAGIPLGLLALHRLADAPSPRRGVALGLAIAVQALLCAYYVVFLTLIVGLGVFVLAASRGYWRHRGYWTAVVVAAAVSLAVVFPLFLPYLMLQRATGFSRSVESAAGFAANWRAYFASAASAHTWMLPFLRRLGGFNEVLFPGYIALSFGLAGLVIGWRAGGRRREMVVLYGSVGALALWASFGPAAGLYSVLYATVPAFSFMRAPSRFGLAVLLALCVLTAMTIAALLSSRRTPRRATVTFALVLAIALVEHHVDLRDVLRPIPPVNPAHRMLATLPDGALLELPVYSSIARFRRSEYMLASTTHWKPLVNAYSDHIPSEFMEIADALGQFPTADSLVIVRRLNVRYALFHIDAYSADAREALMQRLAEFQPALRRLYGDHKTLLFEVVEASAGR